jgi:hypothetical protein
MSAYGKLREEYQAWLSKESLPNEAPDTLLLRTDGRVTPAQAKELREWVKDFFHVDDT